MRILQLTTHLNRGGITSYIYNLSQALLERRHLVFVASSGGTLLSELEKMDIRHFFLPINTKSELSPKLWLSAPRLKKIIEQERIEIVHTHTRVTHCLGWWLSRRAKIYLAPQEATGVNPAPACRGWVKPWSGVHHLSTAHGYYKVRWGRKIFPAWGERIVAISPAVKEHLLNDFKLPEEKIRLIFTGVDLEKFSPESEGKAENFRQKFGLNKVLTVGMIGRVSPEKGHRIFLEAAAQLIKPEVKFVIVGSGQGFFQRELEVNLSDKRIVWIDYLDSLDAFKLIDIFVQPSIQEGLGIALLEAMACGKAVVASRTGGIPSVIDDGRDGLLVPPQDSKSLAQAILRLIQEENLRRCLGLAARQKVEEKFDVRKMAQEIEKVYEELLGS